MHTTVCVCVCVCVCAQLCLTFWDPVDYSPPGSSVRGILQQEYWSALPFPSPEDLAYPGIEHVFCLLLCQVGSLILAPLGKPEITHK